MNDRISSLPASYFQTGNQFRNLKLKMIVPEVSSSPALNFIVMFCPALYKKSFVNSGGMSKAMETQSAVSLRISFTVSL